jgi:hypothetical protein
MDPITTAIIAALAAGVTQGTVVEAYNSVKQLIKKKANQDIIEVIDDLEKDPNSNMGKKWLKKEIQKNQLDQDADILEAAKKLMDEMKSSGGKKNIMQAKGNFIVQADHGSTASVNINKG